MGSLNGATAQKGAITTIGDKLPLLIKNDWYFITYQYLRQNNILKIVKHTHDCELLQFFGLHI